MDESTLVNEVSMQPTIPAKVIVDFNKLAEDYPSISDKEKFVTRMKLCLGEETGFPKTFPEIINLSKAGELGLKIDNTVLESQYLQLPPDMLDSKMYELYPELKAPMEDIIYEYQRMRYLYGFELPQLEGDGWSKKLLHKLNKLTNPKVGSEEKLVSEELEEHEIKNELRKLSVDNPIKQY